jgi:hypothetical protein
LTAIAVRQPRRREEGRVTDTGSVLCLPFRKSKNKNNVFIFGLVLGGEVMAEQKQISNEELLELTRQAFEKNEVAEFLCGEKGYSVMGNRDIPSNIPTDFGRILKFGIYKLYTKENSAYIIDTLKQAVFDLLKKSTTHIWCAYSVCWSQIYSEQSNYAPFQCVDNILLSALKEALYKNKTKLKNCREWLGSNSTEGLWEDIFLSNESLKKRFGVSIL